MKKLMIVAAIAMTAVFANAAAYDWSGSYVFNKGAFASGVAAALFCTSDIAADTLSSQLAAGNFDNWGMGIAKTTDGQGSVTTASPYAGNRTEGSYSFYAVFLDAAKTADAGNFFMTAVTDPVALKEGEETPIALGNLYGASTAAGAWKTISGGDVPEPTSGLLLLLGVAGLALRRRRA